ncbi:tetratricopeptide repeat protein 4 [Strongylocentrotus purpuratus]|uniref:Cns1/TTC4 wheel domain-containing protein n=1 Tax=Strongylocentrotus purpuratus TaxID=7668 RepID=A0A7M7HMP0_STRPU|nr:tetratricopeptide repeat protein 4 [Strongylocentrotus purpuratus]
MAESAEKPDVKKLAEKLDQDIDEFIDNLPKSKYKDGFSEDNWQEEFDKIPLFMTEAPENIEDCPQLEALQQIKFASEESTREDDALMHKDDGNQWFKKKMYKQAVKAYAEGIKQKCADKDINAVLYTNRAAAHFHLGNHRSSLNDAKEALNLKPDHVKAVNRAIDSCMQLKEYGEAVQWCDKGLQMQPSDKKILDLRVQSAKLKKSADKEKRKKQLEEKKQRAAEEKLIAALKTRNLRFLSDPVDGEDGDPDEQAKAFVTSLQSNEPSGRSMVNLDNEGVLHWPVRFLYPEHGHSDLVSAFNEDTRFLDHLEVMFSLEEAPPEWDPERKYQVKNLKVYFEDYDAGKLVELKADPPLKTALQHPRYQIVGGVPTFFILSTATPYHEQFLKKYSK